MIRRDVATSSTVLLFLVMGTTGVMLYFHWFEASVKEMHEILGLVFVGAVVLHVMVNWGSMKRYFAKRVFLGVAALVIAAALGFVLAAQGGKGGNPKRAIIVSVLHAPLANSVAIFGHDLASAKVKLQAQGIKVGAEDSLDAVAKANQTSPFKVVQILSER